MPEIKRGSVEIAGKPYRIDLQSYKSKDITDFSPRSSTPGGGIVFGEMGLYQPLVMTDWSRGFGFQWMTEAGAASGYLRSTGNIDTRNVGIATLMTVATESDTVEQKDGFALFDDHLFAYGPSGGRITDTNLASTATPSWAEAEPVAGAINCAWTNGKYLFVVPDGDRPYYAVDPTSAAGNWTAAGADSAQVDLKWMMHHDGYVYAGRDADSAGLHGNEIHYTDAVDLSDLYAVASDDANTLYAGVDGYPVVGAVSFLGDLDFRRPDGLFRMDRDKSVIRKVLDYADVASTDNFISGAVHNNAYTFPIRNTIYQWNGMRVTNITPPRLTEQYPYTTYGSFKNFVVVGDYLFMTARTNETTYSESILCYDGVGWHRLMDPITDGDGSITSMYYDAARNNLWFHVHKAASEKTYYVKFQANSIFPYPNYPTTGTHSIYTSRIDAGFRRVKKSTPSIFIEATNVTSARYLKVYYSLEGESTWHAWGGVDGTTNIITQEGVTELKDPLGTYPSTIEYYYMQLRVDFVTDTATETPVLEAIAIRLMLRPKTLWGYSMTIVASQDAKYGMFQDNRTPAQIIEDLKTVRDSESPVEYIDPYGAQYYVYVTSVTIGAVEEHVAERDTPNIEARVYVNLAQAG